MRHSLALALVLLGFGLGRLSNLPSAAAQASDQALPITLGPATLRLGMAKDRVLSQFGPSYELSDSGMVLRKPLTPDGEFDAIGSIAFADGKLSGVSKDWVSDQHNIESFWRGLYGSIAGAIGSQSVTAVVSATSTPPEPNFSQQQIAIVLKGRTIKIWRAEAASPKVLAYTVIEDFGKWAR
jgi:hypothetical protein